MKTNFRDFYESHYSKYTKHIQRVDVWRYFCLYKYGGIYADLDFECFYNFYDELDHEKVNVAESPHAPGEPVQNALMASPANHPFWTYVFSDLEKQIVKRDFIHVLFTTGPGLIYREIKRTTRQQLSNILPCEKYAGIANPMKKGEYSHHHGTCVWNV